MFEEQHINTLSAEGEMMLTLLASIAEEERKSVSGNVRWSIRNKFKNGDAIIHTENLIGYTKDSDGNIVIDKEQAKIVRKIYKLYLSGMLPEHIAKKFNEEGIPTCTDNSNQWNYNRIRRILCNEKYVGDNCQLKYYNTEDGKTHHNRGELPKYYIRDNHIPIISHKDWNRTQKIMTGRKKVVRPFTSMLKCPYCGASLHRHKRSDSDLVDWVCGTLLQKKKESCKGVRVPEKTLNCLLSDKLPLKEPLVVMEEDIIETENNGNQKKNFCFIPVSEYQGWSETGKR